MSLPGRKVELPLILGALSLFLSGIEYLIPKPLPFIRLGLANLPLLLALDLLSFRSFMVLLMVKILGQALITGSLFSYVFLFSLGGGLCSALLMFWVRRTLRDFLSLAGISMLGALSSNALQLLLARYLLLGRGALYAAPPILALGTLSGLLLGLFAESFKSRSRWYQGLTASESSSPPPPRPAAAGGGSIQAGSLIPLLFFILTAPSLLFNPGSLSRLLQLCLYLLGFRLLYRQKTRPLLVAVLMAGVILINLLSPYGEALFYLGAFPVTRGALLSGIRRASTVEALLFLSRLALPPGAALALPGRAGILISEVISLSGQLREAGRTLNYRRPLESLDTLLLSLESGGSAAPPPASPPHPIILSSLCLLSWLCFIFAC